MTTSHPLPEQGRRIAGYEVISKLGQGGMGAVFKARQLSLDRIVALKILPKQLTDKTDFISRFSREARMTGQLNHPNIIKVYDVGRSQTGICYYAMEFVEGESLRSVIEREGKLAPARVLRLLEEVARALDHARKHGIIHRDIKPDNILVDMQGNVKLADLGLAKEMDASASLSGASMPGTVIGTPHYMSPEQAEGKPVDTRSDLYSLGATAYHLVAGTPPFSAETPMGVVTKHLTETPAPLQAKVPGTPAGLAKVVHRLLEKDPARRFQTPAELQAEVARLRQERPSPPGAAEDSHPRKPAGKTPWILAFSCILVLGLVAAAALGMAGKARKTPVVPTPPAVVVAPPSAEEIADQEEQGVTRYASQHPDDAQGLLQKLGDLEKAHPGTRAAARAHRRIRDLTEMLAQQAVKEPAHETPPPPLPHLIPPALAEAQGLLARETPTPRDLARLQELLSAPAPSPEDAPLREELQRKLRRRQLEREIETLSAMLLRHAWDAVLLRTNAVRAEYAGALDDPRKAELDALERRAKRALERGSWHEDFEAGEGVLKDWSTAKPPWGRSAVGIRRILDSDNAPPGEAPLQDRCSLRLGASRLGGGNSSLEVQGPLQVLHPGAHLSLRAELLLQAPPGPRPADAKRLEAAYLCFRDEKGNVLPLGGDEIARRLAQKFGFLRIRHLDGGQSEWGTEAPHANPFPVDLDLDLKGREAVKARLCIGISMEESPGRSAVLVIDDIDLSYKEEP